LLSCGAAATAAASCSSSSDDSGEPPAVVGIDAAADADVPVEDASTDAADAGRTFEGEPLAVECAGPSCAIALSSSQSESFCALLKDGTVACWGANANGELGRGEHSNGSANPERVVGVANAVALDRTCAVDDAGAAWCWGSGPFLQGEGGVSTELTPVRLALPPVTKVSVHRQTGCALADGGVLCWGSNEFGQVAPDAPFTSSPSLAPRAVALPSGAPLRELAVNEATFVVREDGSSVSWGANLLVARGTSVSPDPTPLPTTFARLSAVTVVDNRACVTTDGDVYCWGNDVGAEPRLARAPEPLVQVATISMFIDQTRYPPEPMHSRWCAVAPSGSVYCLGENESGQAGDGTKSFTPRPVKFAGLPAPAAQVRTTRDTTCALLTTGEVYCVGNNYYGQLGDGRMRRSSLEPVKVNLP